MAYKCQSINSPELLLLLTLFPAPVKSIPLFARRYTVSCAMCHVALPKPRSLNLRPEFHIIREKTNQNPVNIKTLPWPNWNAYTIKYC